MNHEIDTNIELVTVVESLAKAVMIGFKVSQQEAKELISKTLMDERNNILELISEAYSLKDFGNL